MRDRGESPFATCGRYAQKVPLCALAAKYRFNGSGRVSTRRGRELSVRPGPHKHLHECRSRAVSGIPDFALCSTTAGRELLNPF